MRQLAVKCENCRKAFTPTKIDQKYCCSACRQASYRKRLLKRIGIRKPTEPKPLITATCLHCGGSFWAQRSRAIFCSTSCRSLHHRALKEAIPEALEVAYGIPKEKAADIVETQPIWQVRGLLRDRGFSYSHDVRAWSRDDTHK